MYLVMGSIVYHNPTILNENLKAPLEIFTYLKVSVMRNIKFYNHETKQNDLIILFTYHLLSIHFNPST